MDSTGFLIAGAVAVVAGVGVFAVWQVLGGGVRGVSAERQSMPLIGTILLAVGVLALVTGWLLSDNGASNGESLKTGGIAAGSVVALYALWLNDRRRRVDEERQWLEQRRQELEDSRAEHDRERVADERFIKAVELLGHDADQVRVGAVAALVAVARSRPEYVQTVLDVLCAYLRRPFDHPRYRLHQEDWDRAETNAAERELQVRLSAQRVITDLLPHRDDADAPLYGLDLTGAVLEYFRVTERRVGPVTLRYATMFSSNDFSRTVFHRNVWLTGARSAGGRLEAQLRLDGAVFHRRAWFSGFVAEGRMRFTDAQFLGPVKFSNSRFEGQLDVTGCTFAEPPIDPPEWLVEQVGEG